MLGTRSVVSVNGTTRALVVIAAALGTVAIVLWGSDSVPGWGPRVASASAALSIGLLSAGAIAFEWRRGRPFSPMVIVAAFAIQTFSLRPLFLLSHYDLLASFRPGATSEGGLAQLQSQELVLFLSTHLSAPLSSILLTSVQIGLVFVLAFGIAYYAPWTRGLRAFVLSRPPLAMESARWSGGILTAVAIGFGALGLLAQMVLIARIGGIGGAIASLNTQKTLQAPFALIVLATLPTCAAVAWVALRRPNTLTLWWPVILLTGNQCLFWLLTGSRTRALLPIVAVLIVVHFTVRQWRNRELLAIVVALVFLATSLLVVRQASVGEPISKALGQAAQGKATVDVAVNDAAGFDAVVQLVSLSPGTIKRQDGRRLMDGVSAALPDILIPGQRPEGSDTWFRKQVWGNQFLAGRPLAFPGELWADFRILGVIVGALIFGTLAGGPFRKLSEVADSYPLSPAFYALGVLCCSSFLSGSYYAGIVSSVTYLAPLAVISLLVAHQPHEEAHTDVQTVHRPFALVDPWAGSRQ